MSRLIYKFMQLERHEYLDNELLRFTQPTDLNDPFECRARVDRQSYRESVKADYRIQVSKVRGTDIERARRKTEILRTLKEALNSFQAFQEWSSTTHADHIGDAMGMLCLSGRWKSSLMWTHYASDHRGYCIGFDRQHPFFTETEKDKTSLEQVIYSDDLHVLDLTDKNSFNRKIALRKSSDWFYEDEWRVIVMNTTRPHLKPDPEKLSPRGFECHLHTVPHAAVREVILGIRCEAKLEGKVMDFAKGTKVMVYKSALSQESFLLDRYPMKVSR